MINKRCDYPLVFVHGMFGWGKNEGINRLVPYWGTTSGSIPEYLRDNGYECFEASVGPLSSAWDQACELYAQLMGTRVDYGKAHSKKYGHNQFGREYQKPLFDGWSSNKKIHFVGHSFGGNTIRLLVHLLAYGDSEEKSVSGEDVSDLFKGGNNDLVCSVTAICTPLNGTTAYDVADRLKLVKLLKSTSFFFACIAGRSPLNGKVVDFHLEHFGLTNTPGLKDALPLSKAIKSLKSTPENMSYDLSPEGAKVINELVRIIPNVYYFSFPFNAVGFNKKQNKPTVSDSHFFLLFITSNLMLKNAKRKSVDLDYGNDGLVDVLSASSPPNDPSVTYINGDMPQRGIWNVMPIHSGDHGTPLGLFVSRKQNRNFYLGITKLLKSIEFNIGDTAEKM